MVTEATRRHFPAGAVVSLGLFFTASLSLHVVSHESPTVVTLGLAVLLVVLALAIVGFGIRLLASPDSTGESWRIVGWAVAGSLAVSALGAVLFAHLDGVLSEARESVVARTPGVTIEIDDLPETGVVADGLLTDVFENILNNAVQHNDDGTSHIHVTNVTDDESVTITVADDGPGIADDRKQRIFEWTDGPTADLGFGLYLTKALVQRYGGRIWIEESTELGGAAFSVELRRDLHEVLSARRKLDVSPL